MNSEMNRLMTAHRTIIELVLLEGKSVEEASKIMGIPEATARSRLRLAYKTLTDLAISVDLNPAA